VNRVRGVVRDFAVPAMVFAVLVLVVLMSLGVLGGQSGGGSSSSSSLPQAPTQPFEVAYLDPLRIASFLSQIEGHVISGESYDEVTDDSLNAELELADAVKAGGSTSKQVAKHVVVTESQTDKLDALLEGLRTRRQVHTAKPASQKKSEYETGSAENVEEKKEEAKEKEREVAYDTASANGCRFGEELSATHAPLGSMLLIRNAVVRMPSYLSIYPELRYVQYRHRQDVFGTPPYTFQSVDESVRGKPEHERVRFFKTVGPNPRIPFTITAPYSAHEVTECQKQLGLQTGQRSKVEVTVLLPARLGLITGDPSLLGKPLTILGMVIDNSTGAGAGASTFGDGFTVSTYWPAMSTVKAPLLRELGVESPVLHMPRLGQRRRLFEAMSETATFYGHVVEVLPIAMYN
jgi:hypothetical protein